MDQSNSSVVKNDGLDNSQSTTKNPAGAEAVGSQTQQGFNLMEPSSKVGNFYSNYGEAYNPNKDGKFDNTTHKVFVEMDVLTKVERGAEKEWKESARWIKYEEDVEEGSDRWGTPHVPSLSFHALITLQGFLETGVVLLDLDDKDMSGIAVRVVEQMGTDNLIKIEQTNVVLNILLLKHIHRPAGRKVGKRRNTASLLKFQTMLETKGSEQGVFQRRGSNTAKVNDERNLAQQNKTSGSGSHLALDLSKIASLGLTEEDARWLKGNVNLLKRIPPGSEVALVLVGTDDTLQKQTTAFVRLANSAYIPNVTEVPLPVRFIFVLLGPSRDEMDYTEIGRSIATLMSNKLFYNIAYKASDRQHLLRGIHEFLDSSIVIPPGDWDFDDQCFALLELKERSKAIQMRQERKSLSENPDESTTIAAAEKSTEVDRFARTKRLYGGLIADVRRKLPFYFSDIKDALNSQCLATIVFIYFAAIAGTISFGDLLQNKTYKYVGLIESLFGAAIGGIFLALLGGQPLLIFGTTGVAIVYDEALFTFCNSTFYNSTKISKSTNIDSNSTDLQELIGPKCLAIRTWIGFWMLVIGLVFVAFEGSFIIKYYTRFTQEIYGVFVATVLLYESLRKLFKEFVKHPLQKTYGNCVKKASSGNSTGRFIVQPTDVQPNVALFSLILMFGTFLLANALKKFKLTTYLNATARKIIGNFAVFISIVVMSLLDYLLMVDDEQTTKLKLPDVTKGLKPTKSDDRGWFISPFAGELPVYWMVIAIFPALLLFILVFMEISIAELIVEKKEYKLKKGSGFHLTLICVCVVNMITGYLGMNFISTPNIRCMTHTIALTVYSTNNPPGEKPVIVGVKEQRVTSLIVAMLIGLSVLMAPILKFIPLCVLYGVFLFMGFSALTGPQFPERFMLLFKPPANHPQVLFVRRVRTLKMHLYTGIQVLCLAIFWAVRSSPAALCLPLIAFLLIPFRLKVLPYLFKPLELAALDAAGLELPDPKQKPKPVEETQDKLTKPEEVNSKLDNAVTPGTGPEIKNAIPE